VPSMDHEALVDLFRNRPAMAAEVLREVFGRPLPAFKEARIESTALPEIIPADRRADLVVVLLDEERRPLVAIVVEVQLHRDKDKPFVWPVYITQTRAQHRCPTWLLVVTIEPEMVRWCSRTIEVGQFDMTPWVLGPEGVPVVTDADLAREAPELVVLSAMAHGQGEAAEAIAVAYYAAAAGLDEDRRAFYTDQVLSSLHEAARRKLEEMMRSGYEFKSEFARTYVAKGAVETKARDVLAVLETRGLDVPADLRERVLASTDLAELDQWLRRAVVVSDARDLFATTAS
jgi:hypothetical protein